MRIFIVLISVIALTSGMSAGEFAGSLQNISNLEARAFRKGYYELVGVCNIRSGPGENYRVIRQAEGLYVYASKQKGEWCYVVFDEGGDYFAGWTQRSNLRFVSSSHGNWA